MTVREFLRVMWEGKYFLVASIVLALAAATVYADRKPEVFEATATVQINSVDLGDSTTPAATTTSVDTDPGLVEAPGVLQTAGKAVAAGADPKALAAQVSGVFDATTGIMTVTTTAGTPGGAVELANGVASAYVDSLPGVIDDQITEIDARRDALRDQLDTVDKQVKDAPKDPLAGAERSTIIDQYQTLSASRSTLESIVTPAQVLVPATGSSAVVVGLPRASIVLLGALAGLAIGIGLALARRALDSRLRGRSDAAVAAGVPVLAELYGVTKAARSYRRTPVLPISSRVASPFTESIRELRTALHVAMQDREHAVVVVTATDPHAPRSFIAANLAASWAMSGRATVAVSGDLRRPDLEGLLPRTNGPGTDPDGLRPTQVPNLRFLALYDPTMDPADYLATDRVRATVEAARDAAEVLVIDAPPVLAAADATILGAFADCVVLVTTAGRTARSVLAEAAERLRINGVPLTGVALAGVKGDSRMVYASTYGEPHEGDPSDTHPSDTHPSDTAPADTDPSDVDPSAASKVDDDASPERPGAPEGDAAPERVTPAREGTTPARPPVFPPTGVRVGTVASPVPTAAQDEPPTPAQVAPTIGRLLRTARRP
ncbi:polysaccharide biosynthesis tyrosine autokinase [Krasilnikoviella flava]|uniref:Chromosome partitioning ATPase, Mrp family, contains Fe-S cluster n=1 Tax=Krasilnikoviella flava TaxID=526729 RepID=A0A1T5IEK2_9MICO|nr:hypothetical protein [Krasilnikoviella flava]SKC37594.1 Chromosome partitioning ATPase, Mrp family, contains Fe-S cluster [Krasilnikoviella flava]